MAYLFHVGCWDKPILLKLIFHFVNLALVAISESRSPQHLLWLIYCLCFGSSTFLLCVAVDGYGCMVIAYITTLPLYQSWNLFPLLLLISLSCDRHFSPPPLFFHHHPLGGAFLVVEAILIEFLLIFLFSFAHIGEGAGPLQWLSLPAPGPIKLFCVQDHLVG